MLSLKLKSYIYFLTCIGLCDSNLGAKSFTVHVCVSAGPTLFFCLFFFWRAAFIVRNSPHRLAQHFVERFVPKLLFYNYTRMAERFGIVGIRPCEVKQATQAISRPGSVWGDPFCHRVCIDRAPVGPVSPPPNQTSPSGPTLHCIYSVYT